MRRARAARWREGGRSAAGLSGGEELRLPFVSESKHCPLLSRPRQRAQHRGRHTRGSCQALGVFRGRRGARRAAATRADSQDGRPRGERPEARRAHAGPQRPRTPPPPAGRLPEGRAAGKSRIPTLGRGLGGADKLRAPGAPPAAAAASGRPRAGNFPCLDSSQADPQPSGGGRGAAFGWRETREACSSRAGDQPAERGQAAERTRRWGCPGNPRRRKLRGTENRSGGPSWNGGGESLAWGHGRTCKFQGRERVSEGPEGSGRLRGLPFPPTR